MPVTIPVWHACPLPQGSVALEMPVEISLAFRDHPDENDLEEYAFGRLSDAKAAVLEEHILVCASCRVALGETDEYIDLMKFAASRPLKTPWLRRSKVAVLTSAGILAAACIAATFTWPDRYAATASVTLVSFRGGAGALVNQAAAGHPLDLSLSSADLPPAAHYLLEVVKSTGEPVWSGPAIPGDGRLSAHLPVSLRAGEYWVRLYAQPADLLAEYGLRVK